MLKPEEYIESLRDGRRVFYKGERIADVTPVGRFVRNNAHF